MEQEIQIQRKEVVRKGKGIQKRLGITCEGGSNVAQASLWCYIYNFSFPANKMEEERG